MKITLRKKILILTASTKKNMRVSIYKILSKSVSKLSYGKRLKKENIREMKGTHIIMILTALGMGYIKRLKKEKRREKKGLKNFLIQTSLSKGYLKRLKKEKNKRKERTTEDSNSDISEDEEREEKRGKKTLKISIHLTSLGSLKSF